ncbi:MAG: T9SS type A sorting domain-containing protein [Bacteroidetes bacterium]|nr:T9SS type A sorting domain-containing protein [Bacteroidota bacterium]
MMMTWPVFGQVSVTVTGTNISCYGGNNGTATAIGTGGWTPYTYLWSNGATTQTITGLVAGTYSVTVTDLDQGYNMGSITLTQPQLLGVTAYGESQICGIVPDGKATAVPFGGTPPYTYLWSNGGTSPQITGLPSGTYTVTVTDVKGCTATASATVYFWNEGVWIMDNTVQITCFGANNGSTTVMGMSGTPPYTYKWSANAGNSTSNMLSNLGPGTYTVTVTDANGCSNSHIVVITQPPALVVTTSTTQGICGLPGSATVNAFDGTPPYTFKWSNGSNNVTINVPAGTYTVTVTDANICAKSTTATVTVSPNTLSISTTILSSAGCAIGGKAQATVSGGSGNYSYTWSSVPTQTTSTAINLPAGNYTVTVVDLTTGCTGTATALVPSAPNLSLTTTLLSNANCLTGGSATVAVSGGTPPYNFIWDNNPALNTQTVLGLGAGPHTVKVTDALGCIATGSVTVGQNQGPSVTITIVNNATCVAGGKATAVASGGAGNYTYLWSPNANNATTATVGGLLPGTYTVTVTDAGGCAATATATISQTGGPSVVVSGSSPAGCTTGGSATAGASGGTGPYTYKWNNPGMSTTPTVNNLPPGTYTVTVTDANGCTNTASVSIAAALLPQVVISASTNAKCDQPGSATAVATGGAGTYTYLWDNGETTATAVLLFAGNHSVTVTDANGCKASASVNIGSVNNGIKIGDYVWYDEDQNGFQDVLETNGVPNITVKLIKAGPDGLFNTADDIVAATTSTNANGFYNFMCVTPGTYILTFSGIPNGYQWTGKDKVNNDCKDSDVKSNGQTEPFTILVGQSDNFCFDAGIHQLCTNIMFAGVVCCDQEICEGETPAPFYSVQAPTGGTGNIQYQWLQLVNQGQGQPVWVGIPGANGPTYQPGPLFTTTYFMRCARREGCISFLESNVVKVTVKQAGSPGCGSFVTDMAVIPNGANSVEVRWTTLPEATQYMYTLEHSTDETTWNPVSTLMGKQDPYAANVYVAIDQTPVNGRNYYRIKRSDINGVSGYSLTRYIDLQMTFAESISIYPNPASDLLFVRNASQYEHDVTITVSTTNGAVVHSSTIPSGAIQQLEIPMENLAQGIYLVRINFGNGVTRTLKISKF